MVSRSGHSHDSMWRSVTKIEACISVPAGHKRARDTEVALASAGPHNQQQLTAEERAGRPGGATADRGVWEVRVMRAFARVLRDPNLEPTSDFFASGGDSLAAAAAAAELDVPPQLLAGFPTARSLAAHLAAASHAASEEHMHPSTATGNAQHASPRHGEGEQQHVTIAAAGATPMLDRLIPTLEVPEPSALVGSAMLNARHLPDPNLPAHVLSSGGRCRAIGSVTETLPQRTMAEVLPSAASSAGPVRFSTAWRVPMAECVDASPEIIIQQRPDGGEHRVSCPHGHALAVSRRCGSNAAVGSLSLTGSSFRRNCTQSQSKSYGVFVCRHRLVGFRLLARRRCRLHRWRRWQGAVAHQAGGPLRGWPDGPALAKVQTTLPLHCPPLVATTSQLCCLFEW